MTSPAGWITITAVRGCPIEVIQGIEVDLGATETDSIATLRRNLEESRRRSRRNDVHGVAARYTGRVEQDVDGSLTLHLRRADDQRIRRVDEILQPGLFNAMLPASSPPGSEKSAR